MSQKIVDLQTKIAVAPLFFKETSQKVVQFSKEIRFCSGEASLYRSTSTRCDVIRMAQCIYDFIVCRPHCRNHKMTLSEKNK